MHRPLSDDDDDDDDGGFVKLSSTVNEIPDLAKGKNFLKVCGIAANPLLTSKSRLLCQNNALVLSADIEKKAIFP